MDQIASRDQWMNRLHPLVKLVLTIIYITVTVSFYKYNLAGTLRMGIYPIILFILGDLSLKEAIYRLRIVLPLVCFMGILNPFFDHTAVGMIGGLVLTGGMLSMMTLILKGIFSVLAGYLLIATTSIEKICYSLQMLHIPSPIVTEILLIYRYITVLLGEASRIMQAYLLRAPRQKGVHFKVWGSLAGQLLLRSMDRATEVYQSMTLRGFQGRFYLDEELKLQGKDLLYLMAWVAVFILLKVI